MASLASAIQRQVVDKEVTMGHTQRSLLVTLAVLALPVTAAAATPPPAGRAAAAVSGALAEKVNINTADVTALMGLSGVGRRVAERIVEYRTAHGPFKRPEEIRRVEGVGAGLWERNRARIVIE
jgi:competence protein ComEA